MSSKDVSILHDVFLATFVLYTLGTDALVGIDIDQTERGKRNAFILRIPFCDLEILTAQYHNKDENVGVIPKDFVDAYISLVRIQKYAERNGGYRSPAWVRGEVQ